jgi:hypothetical protein
MKFLGIMIDDTLTWKTHIEMRTPKLIIRQSYETFCITRYFKNDVQLLFSFCYEIWYYYMGNSTYF